MIRDYERRNTLNTNTGITSVSKMRGLLGVMEQADYGNTRVMARFIELYCSHAPNTRASDGSYDDFLAQLDRPDGREFGEDTFDRIVWRYDDLRGGVDPSQATPVLFDPPGTNPPVAQY
jgi:hypothetical protein